MSSALERFPPLIKKQTKSRFLKRISQDRFLLYLLLPGLIWFLIYRYLPMAGLLIAFKDFSFSKGIFESNWVGLDNFRFLFFEQSDFYNIVRNTLLINLYRLVFSFPAPIILALAINELRSRKLNAFKNTVQTAVYIPHFVSWVIFGGIIVQFLSPSNGIVNQFLQLFGVKPIYFLTDPKWFQTVVVATDIWKTTGWGAIIYLAALTGVDPALYDAAEIDGAGSFNQIVHVTLPSIADTIVFIMLLNVGRILMIGFEQIYVLYNPMVYEVGDVISTYVYRVGIGNAQFSLTTAIGLFQSLIGLLMIAASNWVSRKWLGRSLW
jgi:putative aldouronate transport system permease protein